MGAFLHHTEVPPNTLKRCHMVPFRVPYLTIQGCLRTPVKGAARCQMGTFWHPDEWVPLCHPSQWVPTGTIEGVVYRTGIWHPFWCHLALPVLTVQWQVVVVVSRMYVRLFYIHASTVKIIDLNYLNLLTAYETWTKWMDEGCGMVIHSFIHSFIYFATFILSLSI